MLGPQEEPRGGGLDIKPSSMESLVNISKAPLDDVEILSESHEMVTAPSFLTML